MELSIRDVERLENTSFASAFANTAEAAPAEASGVCIISVGCQATYACSNDCVVVETLEDLVKTVAVTNLCGETDALVCLNTFDCSAGCLEGAAPIGVPGVPGLALLDAARGA